VDFVQRAFSGLDHRNAVLGVSLGLVEAADLGPKASRCGPSRPRRRRRGLKRSRSTAFDALGERHAVSSGFAVRSAPRCSCDSDTHGSRPPSLVVGAGVLAAGGLRARWRRDVGSGVAIEGAKPPTRVRSRGKSARGVARSGDPGIVRRGLRPVWRDRGRDRLEHHPQRARVSARLAKLAGDLLDQLGSDHAIAVAPRMPSTTRSPSILTTRYLGRRADANRLIPLGG